MGWFEVVALIAILGVTASIAALGPRIWHSESTRKARRLGGMGVIDEIYRPHTFEQRIVEEQRQEAGDSVDSLEPKDRIRPPADLNGAGGITRG
jgi:hypothetical protein